MPADNIHIDRITINVRHATDSLAAMVAAGQISLESASDCINAWAAPGGMDIAGFRMQLHWRLRDKIIEIDAALAAARGAVRRAVRPLLEAGATVAQIEEAAGTAAADALTWDEIRPILAEEWRAAKRRGAA